MAERSAAAKQALKLNFNSQGYYSERLKFITKTLIKIFPHGFRDGFSFGIDF